MFSKIRLLYFWLKIKVSNETRLLPVFWLFCRQYKLKRFSLWCLLLGWHYIRAQIVCVFYVYLTVHRRTFRTNTYTSTRKHHQTIIIFFKCKSSFLLLQSIKKTVLINILPYLAQTRITKNWLLWVMFWRSVIQCNIPHHQFNWLSRAFSNCSLCVDRLSGVQNETEINCLRSSKIRENKQLGAINTKYSFVIPVCEAGWDNYSSWLVTKHTS